MNNEPHRLEIFIAWLLFWFHALWYSREFWRTLAMILLVASVIWFAIWK